MEVANHSVLLKNNKTTRIYVLALGGTIASVAKSQAEEFYDKPSADIHTLLSALNLDKTKLEVIGEQLLQKISHEISNDDLLIVARRVHDLVNDEDIHGIVITHGTNCIEETAYFISLVINTKKPIVFTGSFRPYKALGYDGDKNLYNSILLASNEKAFGLGVVLTFNDSIVNARDACKLNPSIIGDFSINGVGVIGDIQGQQINIHSVVQHRHTHSSEFSINDMRIFAKIYIIYGHMGMDDTFVKAAISNNAKGIISSGMGKGYQPEEVKNALIRASNKGTLVVRCSRTGQGTVNRDPKMDDNHGTIAAGSLSPQKARILLAVALTKTQNVVEIQRIFDQY